MPAETMKRVLIIEFGAPESEFEALSPAGYVIEGKWRKLPDVGWNLK